MTDGRTQTARAWGTKPTVFQRIALVALIATGALLLGRGCGGVTDTRVAARDQATSASCDYYNRCGLVGPGEDTMNGYTSLSSCQTSVSAYWENTWPVSQCQGHIDEAQVSICISAINATECMNGLDVLATLVLKCPAVNICSANQPAGVDGSTD
jgi:hypothetical protein